MSEVIALRRAAAGTRLRIGFLRLTDSAPVIVADAFGWFADEGLDAELLEEPSWANIADKLSYGVIDAAVIVPPLAFAIELGLRGGSQRLVIPFSLSLGGNTVTLSRDLATAVYGRSRADDTPLPEALAAQIGTLAQIPAFGIVHAYSTHNLLLRYWLASAGLEAGRDYRLNVVSPSRAVEALQAGQIAGFCAGAPWGEIAARENVGLSIATSDDIWANAPEKAFAVRASWAEEHPEALQGALRALARAARFCDAPENASYTGALLSRHRYLNVDSHAILSSLPGGAVLPRNLSRFWRHAATFPWLSHGAWFAQQMARWQLIDSRTDREALVARVYRPDLYRAALAPTGIDLPLADAKPEGAHGESWSLAATPSPIAMAADRFCDGAVFLPPVAQEIGALHKK
jgi:NitT/TauT family transport system ATP-binding protein/nitrate/nitrite transport system substrate-binding protein